MEKRTAKRAGGNPAKAAALIGIATIALAGMLALASCSSAPEPGDGMASSTTSDANPSAYQKITADEGQAMMDAGSPTIVDVRTPQEYADGHIPGAINIPVEDIGSAKPAELTDTDADLIVYCRTGVRSKQASDKLVELGYQHVNDMGGIVDWHGDTVTGNEPGGK